jgi:hypothetical protein
MGEDRDFTEAWIPLPRTGRSVDKGDEANSQVRANCTPSEGGRSALPQLDRSDPASSFQPTRLCLFSQRGCLLQRKRTGSKPDMAAKGQ